MACATDHPSFLAPAPVMGCDSDFTFLHRADNVTLSWDLIYVFIYLFLEEAVRLL